MQTTAGNQTDQTKPVDSGLLCLALVLGFLGKAADPEQIRHDLGIGSRPAQPLDILRAAGKMGAKAKSVRITADPAAATGDCRSEDGDVRDRASGVGR